VVARGAGNPGEKKYLEILNNNNKNKKIKT